MRDVIIDLATSTARIGRSRARYWILPIGSALGVHIFAPHGPFIGRINGDGRAHAVDPSWHSIVRAIAGAWSDALAREASRG